MTDRSERALLRPDLHPYLYAWTHVRLIFYESLGQWFWIRALKLDSANWKQYHSFVSGRIAVQMRRPSYAELARRREM